jgi:hypothetical protein
MMRRRASNGPTNSKKSQICWKTEDVCAIGIEGRLEKAAEGNIICKQEEIFRQVEENRFAKLFLEASRVGLQPKSSRLLASV